MSGAGRSPAARCPASQLSPVVVEIPIIRARWRTCLPTSARRCQRGGHLHRHDRCVRSAICALRRPGQSGRIASGDGREAGTSRVDHDCIVVGYRCGGRRIGRAEDGHRVWKQHRHRPVGCGTCLRIDRGAANRWRRPLVVAIDGPSGSRKSAPPARWPGGLVSPSWTPGYVSGGHLAGVAVGVELSDSVTVARLLASAQLDVVTDPDGRRSRSTGTTSLRPSEIPVTAAVSAVATAWMSEPT